ncbi:MAG: class I SAM-dependent methyltransferase [Gammaproteobacteria bacterium]|uniref:class I SAM-dependent methyltransferase n=1 Tax=Hydrogenophaga sp. TaxID=1904254 RepID=UPI0025C0070C|nr:class I SAM-dependent methyltransferase [Hydrogenophaga sp.]MBU4181206.1 class I SAM-dependent methyltransferase [Gammaproteobacteria bacterium]MBU4281432.1 class I SAM-dependent methyltransferase [Gammaproteobacteria bacterium]MBU4325298.1 class I SAM-dependent methyltransferase [Gammaproteobacteria bacterium]MCG2654897.1 class I SAM-dependent methyltransferase [Hydrogenophaga sp.]
MTTASAPVANTPGTPPDGPAFKAAAREQWDRSAPGWNAHTAEIRAWLRPATDAMIDMAGVGPGDAVLDVAAGAGDQSLDIAQRVGPTGRVLATDLSPAILALARDNARLAGHGNVQTLVADGEALPVPPASFDAVVCRLGLMFFPDPQQGLRAMHRALRTGGGICTVVFSRPERNPCIGLLMATALRHAGLPPRNPNQPGGLLSLGQPGLCDQLFQSAGFRQVATTALDAPFRLPTARHYLDFVRASASPIQQILGRLEPEAAEAAWADMEERLGKFNMPGGWVGPNELLLTAAQR